MGQYYYVVNLDKKQYLHPHRFGDGSKLLEFGDSMGGTMTALAILLADGNNRGGGDLHSENPIIGSWAGDRIVIAGDYADGGKFFKGLGLEDHELQVIADECFSEGYNKKEEVNLYHVAQKCFEEISAQVIKAMKDDPYLDKELGQRLRT